MPHHLLFELTMGSDTLTHRQSFREEKIVSGKIFNIAILLKLDRYYKKSPNLIEHVEKLSCPVMKTI